MLKWLGISLAGLLGAIVSIIYLAIDSQALVRRSPNISPDTIAQARTLLKAENELEQTNGAVRRTSLPQELVDQAINYLGSRYLHGRGDFRLKEDSGEIRLSVPLTQPLLGYINLRLTLGESEQQLRIVNAKIGSLPLPTRLIEQGINEGFAYTGHEAEWKLALHSFRRLEFDAKNKKVDLSYVWAPAILDKARALALSTTDVENVQKAHHLLVNSLVNYKVFSPVPLVEVLTKLLQANDLSPGEQRASLLVLSAYLANKELDSLIPTARNWPKARPVTLVLQKREDTAQHFIISAALAAWGGEPVADAIGLYKEIADSQDGSGFSFADLAADRAGTRFGKLLRENPANLNKFISNHRVSDQDISPKISDLPENMPEAEFKSRFGEIGSMAYQDMTNKIESRISDLPLYQTNNNR